MSRAIAPVATTLAWRSPSTAACSASDLVASEELRTAVVPGGPDGIDRDGLATLPIDYEPGHQRHEGHGLPNAEVSQIYTVQGTGTYDGISHAALAAAAGDPRGLLAAGRRDPRISRTR